MKVKFIYGVIPIPVFYVDEATPFSDAKYVGQSFGFFVLINKDYKNDKGLLEHELQHCRQCYRTLGFHGIIYHMVSTYRSFSEIEAYKVQLKYCTNKEAAAKRFAGYIARDYKLHVCERAIYRDLLKEEFVKVGTSGGI